MKKLTKILLPALIISALIMSCGMFDASPTIDSFTASDATIDAGENVTFTVKGSTKDPSVESDLIDYSGSILISVSPGNYTETIDVTSADANSFTKTTALTFPAAGTFTITATLTSGSKAVEKTVTITVNAAPVSMPWDGETVTTLSYKSWKDDNINYTGDVDWFKYESVSSSYYIHWQDNYDQAAGSSYTGDVKVSVYNAAGTAIIEGQDSGYSTSELSYGSGNGIRIIDGTDYTLGEYFYIKVVSYDSSPSTGTYSLYITN